MLTFPHYADKFYPANENKEVLIVNSNDLQTARFTIEGMTCKGCAAHVENDVNKLAGIISVRASYEKGAASVEFDRSKVSMAQIEEAINNTGYQVVNIKKTGHEDQK